MKPILYVAAFLLGLLAPEEKLSWKNYGRFRTLINVKLAELSWQQVEWRDGYWNGLVEAQAKDKPLFFWIYEGDPRGGC